MPRLKHNTIKRTGVWLDKNKAIIVWLHDDGAHTKTLLSNIEHYNPHGGSGTRLKGDPQDVVQDSKYLEREKHQLKRYFKNLVSEIKNAHAIVLFGPADTCTKFNKELSTNYKALSTKVKDVIKADSMTNAQITAFVKRFFKSKL